MCGCETQHHFDDWNGPLDGHPFLGAPAGEKLAMYVGEVCDECASTHLAAFILN